MAMQAEGANIREIALAASLDHGHDVIRVPQAPATQRFQSPDRKKLLTTFSSSSPNLQISSESIDRAPCADSTIALQNSVS